MVKFEKKSSSKNVIYFAGDERPILVTLHVNLPLRLFRGFLDNPERPIVLRTLRREFQYTWRLCFLATLLLRLAGRDNLHRSVFQEYVVSGHENIARGE